MTKLLQRNTMRIAVVGMLLAVFSAGVIAIGRD